MTHQRRESIHMVSRLISVAQKLDQKGMHYAADVIENTLQRMAGIKQPWEMTFDEFFDSLKTRTNQIKAVDLSTWLNLKGLKEGVDFASADQYATYIGQQTFGAFRPRSQNEIGKQKRLEALVKKREAVMREYDQTVPMNDQSRDLDPTSASDATHVRVMHKRAIRKALAEGKFVPEHILALYGMSTKD